MSNSKQPGKMARIVVVYNEKGGSGKSTLTCQLAGTLGLRGYDVLVADLDSQEATSRWLSASTDGSFPATLWTGHRFGSKINSEFERLMTKYDIIVADCAPSVEQPSTWAALLVADLALIPTKVNPSDVSAVPAAKNLAKKVLETTGRSIPFRVVPVAVRKNLVDDAAALQSFLQDTVFPPFILPPTKEDKKKKTGPVPLTLGDRKAFTRPMLIGATAHALRHSQEAVAEIETLAEFTLHTLELPMFAEKESK